MFNSMKLSNLFFKIIIFSESQTEESVAQNAIEATGMIQKYFPKIYILLLGIQSVNFHSI